MTQTLTYSRNVDGWTSFFSFAPDWMIGMNNYFYTMKEGNLYRHNVNPVRCNFYNQQFSSSIKSVINESPLENKLFKTLEIEGDAAWSADVITDIQVGGHMDSAWFERKEQAWFSYIRMTNNSPASQQEFSMRRAGGIGLSSSVSFGSGVATINFSVAPLLAIGNVVSVGDYIYFVPASGVSPYPPTSVATPSLAGQVTAINTNYPSGINNIVINTTISGTVTIPGQHEYFLYMKNSVAESPGMLGHYAVFELTNTSTTKVELFSVVSDIMKSFP